MLLHLCATNTFAQDVDGDARQLVRVEAAVDRAIEYLASKQDPAGWWPQGVSSKPNTGVNAAFVCLLSWVEAMLPAVDRTEKP